MQLTGLNCPDRCRWSQ